MITETTEIKILLIQSLDCLKTSETIISFFRHIVWEHI